MFQRDFIDNNAVWLRKLLLSHHETLAPSAVSQLHLMPPATALISPSAGKTRYPASDVRRFLTTISELGLGTMTTDRAERITSSGNAVLAKSSTKFKKRNYSELEPVAVSTSQSFRRGVPAYHFQHQHQHYSTQHRHIRLFHSSMRHH